MQHVLVFGPLNTDVLTSLHPSFLKTSRSLPPPDPTCPVGGRVWMQGCTGATCRLSVPVLASPLSTNQKLLMLMKGAPLLALPDSCSLCVETSAAARLSSLHHRQPCVACLHSGKGWRGPKSNPRPGQTQKKPSWRTQAEVECSIHPGMDSAVILTDVNM